MRLVQPANMAVPVHWAPQSDPRGGLEFRESSQAEPIGQFLPLLRETSFGDCPPQ